MTLFTLFIIYYFFLELVNYQRRRGESLVPDDPPDAPGLMLGLLVRLEVVVADPDRDVLDVVLAQAEDVGERERERLR